MSRGRPKGSKNKIQKCKLSYKNQKNIVEMYCGIMTEQEIHEEFGIAPSTQRHIMGISDRMANNHNSKQLCWDCEKATNMFRCIFVKSCLNYQPLKYYEGTELTKSGKIVSCPQFVKG